MAGMTVSLQELPNALFLPAGVHVAAGEMIAVDSGTGTLLVEVRGTGIPDAGEVRALFQRHQPVTVAFEPVRRDSLKSDGWPSWAP
jgi:hypothetical protein